ncbi:MAG: hypothetical protein IH955_10340, partial [Chloroflexi bacterium]|nr:hypothetical protein [Chloroflexota bacterium]
MRKLSYLFVMLAVLMSIVGLACGPDTSLGLVDHKTITGILEGTKYTILIYRSDEEGSPALYVKDQDLLDRITIEEVNLVIDDALALDIESAAMSAPIPFEFYSLTGIGHGIPAQLGVWMVDGVTLSVKIRDFMYNHLQLAALGAPFSLVHVDFGYDQLETGSQSRPWNTLGEALAMVESGGIIRINGNSSVVVSDETF